MAEIITMPRLSDTMTEGVVAKWLKKVGDHVEEGDILAEIETDKATMEFESFHEGTLLHIGIQEGETASVDSLLAIIGEKGEDFKSLLSSDNGSAPEVKEETPSPVAEAEENSSEESTELPAGMEVVTMPKLSDTMTEGTVGGTLIPLSLYSNLDAEETAFSLDLSKKFSNAWEIGLNSYLNIYNDKTSGLLDGNVFTTTFLVKRYF